MVTGVVVVIGNGCNSGNSSSGTVVKGNTGSGGNW